MNTVKANYVLTLGAKYKTDGNDLFSYVDASLVCDIFIILSYSLTVLQHIV